MLHVCRHQENPVKPTSQPLGWLQRQPQTANTPEDIGRLEPHGLLVGMATLKNILLVSWKLKHKFTV